MRVGPDRRSGLYSAARSVTRFRVTPYLAPGDLRIPGYRWSMERKTLLLSAAEVLSCLDLDEVFRVVEKTFRETGLGRTVFPPKLFMYLPERSRGFPLCRSGERACGESRGVKIVTGYKDNRKDSVCRTSLPS